MLKSYQHIQYTERTVTVNEIMITTLNTQNEARFYALAEEYLPGSDPEVMRKFAEMYPEAFLTISVDGTVAGAAFGWPRRHSDPSDASFTLDGICIDIRLHRSGLGRKLLARFESAAKFYGAPAVSVGSAGGYVEKFYLSCGYLPKEYKAWEENGPVIEHIYSSLTDYESYNRKNPDGFVVFEKTL